MTDFFEIWSEGYDHSWGKRGMQAHGCVMANSFEEACGYFFKGCEGYDPIKNTLWGGKLFDNENDAKIKFGIKNLGMSIF